MMRFSNTLGWAIASVGDSNRPKMVTAALSAGVGYGIVLGLGLLFAIGMIATTYVLKRYNRELQTSEMFTTAGRTVKSGLVGSAVVSSWTWAATLLQSSGVCYRYGVSGPFWYASGATVQILLFATLAIQLKRRAPNAHTFLEVIKARYGTVTHIVFIIFGLMTNILVTLMLIVGGAATVNALTGMHTVAAIYLLPVGVVAYTLVGGLKATFLTDWVHTFILLIIIILFSLTAYASSDVLGSPSKVYDLLVEAATRNPVAGNAHGSYLTMKSQGGVEFFVINIVGNFGTVFLDNGYYNKAIAASPVHALPGYILGGLSWFAIPWLTATTMGLSALALESNPRFPTFPERMTEAEVSAGLALPYAAVALLGKGGAVATLLMIFMAVTSASSAELIAVSSIFTYDIYRTYFKPDASGKRLIYMSHVCVVIYALIISSVSVGLFYNGISMGYLYVLMGVLISAAVLPATLTLVWKGQNKWAATLSPIFGTIFAIIGWLVTAKKTCGVLDVTCTGSNNPMLAGNVIALLSPIVLIPIFTLLFGMDKYDWKSMMAIRRGDDHDLANDAGLDLEEVQGGHQETQAEFEREQAMLSRAFKISVSMTAFMTIAMLVLWPMPMYGSGYVFSKPFFTGWVAVGILWIFCSFFAVGLFPIFEGRATLIHTVKSMLSGKKPTRHTITQGEAASEKPTPRAVTPEKKDGGPNETISSS
ncbi:urea active transporter [Colletotrichum truncatum]|uniref:Urea active transporter n=1 Tax=Colletotrichum truncatum TaxID=5467 RepID=A0ACC3YZC1_COLTU